MKAGATSAASSAAIKSGLMLGFMLNSFLAGGDSPGAVHPDIAPGIQALLLETDFFLQMLGAGFPRALLPSHGVRLVNRVCEHDFAALQVHDLDAGLLVRGGRVRK